jgi:uncharacterized protein (TIGR02246 family)
MSDKPHATKCAGRIGSWILVGACGILLAACQPSPVEGPATGSAISPPDQVGAQLPVVPPAAARDIHALLQSWRASWNAGDGVAYGLHYSVDADFVNPLGAVLTGRTAIANTHVFLFNPNNGPFRGSTTDFVVRRMIALSGTLTLVDVTVTLTGYAGIPPGLVEWAPGAVVTRHHMVVQRKGDGWEIMAQQITAMQPGVPQ